MSISRIELMMICIIIFIIALAIIITTCCEIHPSHKDYVIEDQLGEEFKQYIIVTGENRAELERNLNEANKKSYWIVEGGVIREYYKGSLRTHIIMSYKEK